MKKRLVLFVGLFIAGSFLGSSACAATITWGAPTTISADANVLSVGEIKYAYTESNAGATVNGVAFVAGNSNTSLGGGNITMSGFSGLNNTTFSNPTGLSSEYAKLTKGAAYGGTGAATITLNNLAIGHVYLVQVWVNDSRADGGRTETVTSLSGNTVTLDYNNTGAAGGAGQYTIGRFLADGTTQSFTLQGNASTQLNAIQVRDITNIGNWTGIGGATWDAATTLNFADNLYSVPLNNTTFATAKLSLNSVTFGDTYWNSGAATPVTQTSISVAAAGVSVGTVCFDNSAVNYTVANVSGNTGISGTTALVKSGSGLVTLSSVNSYSGGTTVDGGILKLNLVGRSSTQNPGLRANTIMSLGTLELYNTATGVDNVLYQNSSFSGSGKLAKTGAGYLTLHTGSTIANFTGTMDVQQGTLGFNNMGAGANAPTSTLNVATGATADLRYNSVLSVDKLSGSGTLTHSYTDGVTANIGGNNGSSTFSGVITNLSTGSFSLTKNGSGTLTLTGVNGYNGATTISGGTLQLGDGTTDGSILTTSAIIDNGILAFNILGNQSYSQLISGSGALTKTGTGALTLSNTNIFSGATQITNGKIILGNALALQNSAYDTTGATGLIGLTVTGYATPKLGGLNGGVDLGTALTGYSGVTGLTLNPQAGVTATYSGGISDGAAGMTLTKTGAGTQILSGVNTYFGSTTLSAGTLVVPLAAALPGYNSTGKVIINGGAIFVKTGDGTTTGWSKTQLDSLLSNATQTSGTLGIDTSSGNILQSDALPLSNLNTTFGLTKLGANTLTLDQINTYMGNTTITGGTLALNASGGNAIAGNVTISDGIGSDILQLNAANQIADTSVLTFISGGSGNSAIFRLNGNDETVKGITTSVAASAVIENNGPTAGTNTLTVNTAGSSYTYDGILRNNSGSGNTSVFALTKVGAGTLTLNNSIGAVPTSFTGLTTINGGTLNLAKGGNTGTLPAGNIVIVNSGGTLRADVTDALGYYTGSLRVIELVGGTMTVRAGVHVNMAALSMTGGTLTSEGPGSLGFEYVFNTNLTVNASAATSTINCNAIVLRGSGNNGIPGPVTFFVADGEAAVDLLVTANILHDTTIGNALIKAGEGLMQLSNTNSYRNGTAIAAGTLKLAVTNALIPSGALTVAAAGTLDVTNVTQTVSAFTNAPGGTLRTTVAPNAATCGMLTVSSGVDVSGMIVNVANPADLRPGRSYTLLKTTSGTIAGKPALSGVSYLWSLRKENGDTELAIRMVGTMISFQ